MFGTLAPRKSSSRARRRADEESPDLLEWLRSGRLTLVDGERAIVTEERWAELPASVRANAVADFHRVARGRTKAVVLFLRD